MTGSVVIKRVALAVVLTSTVAAASPVKPPAGWTGDSQQAISLSQQLGALPHFGGVPSVVTTEAYRAPAGGSLFVTRMVANIAKLDPKDRDRAATTELDELRRAMLRAGATAKFDSGQGRAIAGTKILEATGRWHDESTGVAVTSRMVIAADAQQLIAVTGECVLAADAVNDVVTACNGALASLDPELPADARVELTLSADAVPIGKPAAMQPPAEGSSGPALLDDGKRPVMSPMSIPQTEHEKDRRPVFVGLGLIVLAVIFWWNRRRREQLEREHEAAPVKPAAARDADDLHAAAEEQDTGAKDSGTKESKDS